MGRRISPARFSDPLRPLRAVTALLCLLAAAGMMMLAPSTSAFAQSFTNKPVSKPAATPGQPDKLLLQADELVYNRDKNSVAAQGAVRLYYQGRTLQADKVIYDRATSRVFASGNAKLTEADGTVSYGEKFELSDDFKDGFIDSLRADTVDKTHFTAARAERSAGETTVFEKGTYTACEACKGDPSRPPFWQVRAKRIIHKGDEQTVYYEDATLEFFGFPVAYLPYFSAPDATVTRRSGVLAPHYIYKSTLGVGVSIPYFWALAPDHDLTFTPTFLSRQGFLGEVEWRQRLLNGSYSVRAAGIFQQDRGVFLPPPFGPGNRDFRGSVESTGLFFINERWKFGWNATATSDKWFTTDYKQPTTGLTNNYFRETISTAYLTGQGQRGYFDLRGYYIQGQSKYDFQKQQPVVLPVIDYNKTFDLRPERTAGIGGQVEIDFNAIALTREAAAYQATGARTLDNAFSLYDVCTVYAPGTANGRCLVRGIGGDYARATLNLSWKRKIIDPIGQVWTPFAFAHVSGSWLKLNTTNSYTFASANGTSVLQNASQNNFFNNTGSSFNGEASPGVGLEYRYPFIAQTSFATHIFEPIAQIIARPNSNLGTRIVNEDAQSLVFDDTNLFEWSKYSGYDRFETGVRANLGAQYTAAFTNGGYANVMAGQSFQLAGRNSYARPDAANVGISSGLDSARSDYVARTIIAPWSNVSFIAKGRFDESNFTMRRLDLAMNAKIFDIDTSLQYARYSAQPALGYDKRREGLSAMAKYKFLENYSVEGNVVFDLSRHLYNGLTTAHVGPFSVAGLGVGVGYEDTCTTFNIKYNATYRDNATNSTRTRSQSVLFELKLRTLGDTKVKTSLGSSQVTDGL